MFTGKGLAAMMTEPMGTPTPMIYQRQASDSVSGTANPQFIGYSVTPVSGGRVVGTPVMCETDSAYLQSGSFADCCPTAVEKKCAVANSCVGTQAVVGGGFTDTLICLSQPFCATQTIYSALSRPEAGFDLKIICANHTDGQTVYRDIATSTSTSSSTTLSPSSANSSPTSSANHIASSPSSKAWVAGPVIGGLLALAAGLYLLVRRFRRREADGTPIKIGLTAATQLKGEYQTVPMDEDARMNDLPEVHIYRSLQTSELEANSQWRR
ncbi:hypothetical protein FKW77_004763 [Venturia effusa]|uniref:Uncharacterized protein n=1 Tax=Venturia effusa TaxID=50376 RepID=A0A517L975_9PEZI|nr:hypothetical protein FKW77_004763 [Venturia effusa]